jgi:surfactin synthase thioesterase subunit
VPVLGCYGTDDTAVPAADCQAWQDWTTAGFRARAYPGGHFFPLEQGAPLLAAIRDALPS